MAEIIDIERRAACCSQSPPALARPRMWPCCAGFSSSLPTCHAPLSWLHTHTWEREGQKGTGVGEEGATDTQHWSMEDPLCSL